MAEVKEIQDVCWELFGGSCGVLESLDEMMGCDRNIRECDVFIPAFREAVALRSKASKKPAGGKAAGKKAGDKKKAGGKKK